ncbi:hypothetical protein [Deminuibacter soli]|uniref:hypothetical protein n=1 Tax=Deminuibacter soli TaxID=2291815 RepID=UPI001B86C0F7|nr:hypothetical protein [Deminuibacter soli]
MRNYSRKIFGFNGTIHYPILDGAGAIALPLVYFYVTWISNHKGIIIVHAWPWALLILIGAIFPAYITLKWYDEPVANGYGKTGVASK